MSGGPGASRRRRQRRRSKPEPGAHQAVGVRPQAGEPGDDLSRPDVIKLGDATDDSGSHELSQDEIDARFRPKEDAILRCIMRARPDEDAYVPGRVTVKFRIQRTGNVRGVRVEAPAILHKGGLYSVSQGRRRRHSLSAVEQQPGRVLSVLADLGAGVVGDRARRFERRHVGAYQW